MNRLKNAVKAFRSNTADTQVERLIDFLGIDRTDKKALSDATYFACMKVLAESIGKLPIKLMRYTERNGVENARKESLYYVVKERPNPFMSASSFWSTVEYNRNEYGNAYVLITGAGTTKKPFRLWILPSNQIQVYYDDAKAINDIPDIYYVYSTGSGNKVFGSDEILHFKTSNMFDGLVGISVKEQLKMTIQGGIKSQNVINKMYDSGFTAKAVLQYTGNLSDENVRKLVKGYEKYSMSDLTDDEIKNIIPVPIGQTLTPLNINLADNQFIDVKKYTALQIASAFGIKPYQIGDYEKSSYASAEAQQLSFYIDTLLYIIKQYEEELTYKLLTDEQRENGLHFKFNVGVILRADSKTQIETLCKAVSNFIYTPNEARAFLDLEFKDGGDKLLGNGATIPVELAGTQYIKNESSLENEGKEEA